MVVVPEFSAVCCGSRAALIIILELVKPRFPVESGYDLLKSWEFF